MIGRSDESLAAHRRGTRTSRVGVGPQSEQRDPEVLLGSVEPPSSIPSDDTGPWTSRWTSAWSRRSTEAPFAGAAISGENRRIDDSA